MTKQAEKKTNAMRELERAGQSYEAHSFECPEAISGVEVARVLNEDPDCVFKTLVTVGKSGDHYVFMIPVAMELDLKKAAAAVGEKSVHMVKSKELLGLTGYVHGGCSPVGMKKQFPTVFHETAESLPQVAVSAGKIGYQVVCDPKDLMALLRAAAADLIVE